MKCNSVFTTLNNIVIIKLLWLLSIVGDTETWDHSLTYFSHLEKHQNYIFVSVMMTRSYFCVSHNLKYLTRLVNQRNLINLDKYSRFGDYSHIDVWRNRLHF